MSAPARNDHDLPAHTGLFATTHWSVVLRAGQTEQAQADDALAILCETYRPPILSYARGLGLAFADAEDLTQSFFLHFLKDNLAGKVERRTGVKFRSYLLRCFKNFLADERDRLSAKKRGGGQTLVSLDESGDGNVARWEPVDDMTAEKIYERDWATALLSRVLDRLEREYHERGRTLVFARLHVFLLEKGSGGSYGAVAPSLGMTEEAVKKEVSRLRQRYRELFREEIAHTVASPSELEEEMNHLFKVLSG